MVNCRYLFRRSKINKIEVKKKSAEHQPACKEELENVTACWRNSGIDSRNCVGLVATLAACIVTANIVPRKGFISGRQVERTLDANAQSARSVIDKLNRAIGKYLHRE